MATVRVKDDVNTMLKAKAATDPEGRSATQLADHWLRVGLGMIEPEVPAPDPEPAPKAARAPKPGRARITGPRARQAATAGPPAKCSHPIGRRVNGHCLVCGASVG